jgi:hypothetical protein
MIIIVPTPNNNNARDATVDDNEVAIVTVASAMSRNAVLPSSTAVSLLLNLGAAQGQWSVLF